MSHTPAQTATDLPIACALPDEELARRGEELSTDLFSACEQVSELPDGYAFRFPGERAWADKLLAFISSERECCPFFTFELLFEPDGGPISLRMRGPEGTKEFIGPGLAEPGGE